MTRTAYVCLFAAALCSYPQTYDDYMRKGAQSFNKGEIDYALRAYEDALKANPSSALAKLHLSYVIMGQPNDGKSWNRARQLSSEVLQLDPANTNAEWNLALLAMSTGHHTETTTRCNRILAKDPQNPECLFATAVSSWAAVWPEVTKARQQLGVNPAAPGLLPDAAIRDQLRKKYDQDMALGLERLTELRKLHPNHKDAAAYQNLIQRTRSVMAASEQDFTTLLADADRYVKEALAIRRRAASEPAVRLDPTKLPPMSAMPKVMAPPPPPPPPPSPHNPPSPPPPPPPPPPR